MRNITHSRTSFTSRLCGAVLAVLAVTSISTCVAQNRSTAEITGRVTDPTGALVRSAEIAIRNEATNVVLKAKTNDAGIYDVPLLPPGVYTITFTGPGFQTTQRSGIRLELDQTARIDTTLSIGQADQIVQVTATQPLLHTEDSEVNTVFSEELTHGLPLVGRTPTQLAVLAPGTSTAQSDAIGVGTGGSIDPGRVNVSGGRAFTVNATLDGAPLVLPGSNNFGNEIPALDAVSEFSVVQNNFGAQYANGTSVLNIVLKSGTDRWHGSAFEYLENDYLNATSGFATSKPKLRYNQPGGTLGGSILRGKLFFFGSYQNTLVPSSSFRVVTVPTAAEKAGDFSAFLSGPNPRIIYDPLSKLPFAGNVIPASRFDPVAKAALSYWPTPNYGGGGAITNNYATQAYSNQQTPIYNGKVDWKISGAHSLSVSSHDEPYKASINGAIPGPACYSFEACGPSVTFDQTYQVAERWIVSSHAINAAYMSYIREHYGLTSPSDGGNFPQKLGLTGTISQKYFPFFGIQGSVPTSLGPGAYYAGTSNSYNYADVFSWSIAKHTLSFGGQFNAAQLQNPPNIGAPSFNFNGQYTGGAGQSGIGFADFLLGQVQSYNFNSSPTGNYGRRKTVAAFVQDDWKVTPKLTLNLGLRYQYEGSWTEAHNILSNFSPTADNPATHTPGAIEFASQGAFKGLQNPHGLLFAPRVGFSASVGHQTVVRGGYGVFHQTRSGETNFNGGTPGYGISQSLTSQTLTSPPVFQLSSGPPAYVVPTDANRTGSISNGQGLAYWPRSAPQPYQQEWHLSVQHQLGSQSTAEISYVGSLGKNLLFPRDLNQVPYSQIGSATDRTNPQSLRPFPQYQGIFTFFDDGSSNYNALETRYDRRFSNGLTVLSNYTFARSLDTSSFEQTTFIGNEYQLAGDPEKNYGVSSFNQTHRAVIAYVYQLPVGKGKTFLNNNAVVDALVGGWTNSSSFIAHSGVPFTVFASGSQTSGLLAGNLYANCLGNSQGSKTSRQWLNAAAFSDPGNYTIGTCSRTSAVGPAGWDWDTAVLKDFSIHDFAKLQIRADAFNLLNHRPLGLPNATVGSSAFGTITRSAPPRIIQVGAHISF